MGNYARNTRTAAKTIEMLMRPNPALRGPIIPFFFAALLMPLSSSSLFAEWHYESYEIFGTNVSIQFWSDDPTKAELLLERSEAELWRIHNQLSPYLEDSELSKVNKNAFNQTIPISEELSLLIDKSLYFSDISNGAFDITFASLGFLYDYREGQKPSDKEIDRLKSAINYRLIDFDKDNNQIRFSSKNMKIDLGGIAKGYAIDRAASLLSASGVTNAAITAGGDSIVIGDKRGLPWIVGVRNPRAEGSAVRIPLENAAISTSGDYERFFIDQSTGERIHHILNPKSGKSANKVASVSVIGPRGLDTDPLSTTLFVLGVEKGLSLIEQIPEFDAIFIDVAGKVHYSDGLLAPE